MGSWSRREFIHATSAAGAIAALHGCGGGQDGGTTNGGTPYGGPTSSSLPPPPEMSADVLISDTQQRTFRYFWETTDAARGLAPDFAPESSPASIAAMGFMLTAVPIGIEHAWITRAQGAERVLNTLQFLRDAPQGAGAQGYTGYHGFFYHFLDMASGTRYRDSELSSMDTALLLMGVRCCGQYFNGADASETAIRSVADFLCERVDWPWFQVRSPAICMGWRPESGFLSGDWIGYNEAIPVLILALGSTAHAVGVEAWTQWTSGYPQDWGVLWGYEHLTFGPLFGHHFPQVWLDMRGIKDSYMAAKGLDYFENSRRAVLSQRAYATTNPLGWLGHGADIWGLSACNGPAETTLNYHGAMRQFHTYFARGVGPPDNFDDGTLTPTAPIGSFPFAPEVVTPAIAAMYQRYGTAIYGNYGFLDSYNPSFQYNVPVPSGRIISGFGWVDTRYYGINQGPIVAMIENQRSGLLWSLSRADPVLRRGLQRAGFTGGWLG